MTDALWTYDKDDRCWSLRFSYAWVSLQQRPHYCDRGRWVAVVSGVGNIDNADAFPRYFMDLERAKAEMGEWLAWRVNMTGKQSALDAAQAKVLAVDQLAAAVGAVEHMKLMTAEGAKYLRSFVDALRARHGGGS